MNIVQSQLTETNQLLLTKRGRVKALFISSPVSVLRETSASFVFIHTYAFQCFQCTDVVVQCVQDLKKCNYSIINEEV